MPSEAAIQLFKDEAVTLGRAAELAGLTRWEFEAILTDRGIERVVACDAAENLERQVKALRQFSNARYMDDLGFTSNSRLER